MDKLPEFRVELTRLKEGEHAHLSGGDAPHYEYQGRRTKLGGDPDCEQPPPQCYRCHKVMTFVAQIDSVEHDSRSNSHRVAWDAKREAGQRRWMFGDVGMIYVYFCFDCVHPEAAFECG